MPASSLIQCVSAIDLVNWIQLDWFFGQQAVLLFPSANYILGFKSQLTGPPKSCQFDSRIHGDNFINEILKEYPKELRARRYILKETLISF